MHKRSLKKGEKVMCWTELKLSEVQAFHFGEQMFKCPRGGGWGQKMRCDSGREHVFPGGGGEEPGFTAPNSKLERCASLLRQRPRPRQTCTQLPSHTSGSHPTPQGLVACQLTGSVQDIFLGTVPSTGRMSNLPWGLLFYPRG